MTRQARQGFVGQLVSEVKYYSFSFDRKTFAECDSRNQLDDAVLYLWKVVRVGDQIGVDEFAVAVAVEVADMRMIVVAVVAVGDDGVREYHRERHHADQCYESLSVHCPLSY